MKIVCCIKHAPDSAARIQIGAEGKSISTDGIDFNPSPFDEYGVENALKLKEAGEGEVVVVTVGGEAAVNSLRKVLAMGADRAIHLKTEGELDARATGKLLAEAIKNENPDAIFFGYQAIDTNDGQVPAFTCHHLDIPLVSLVSELTLEGDLITAHRQIEGAQEVVQVKLPAALACTKGKNEPRFPSLPGIMKAKKKPLDTQEVAPADLGSVTETLTLPPQREAARFIGEGKEAVGELVNRLKTEAKVI